MSSQMERERGISISSTCLSFEFCSNRMNLLDTPGHADFSEARPITPTPLSAHSRSSPPFSTAARTVQKNTPRPSRCLSSAAPPSLSGGGRCTAAFGCLARGAAHCIRASPPSRASSPVARRPSLVARRSSLVARRSSLVARLNRRMPPFPPPPTPPTNKTHKTHNLPGHVPHARGGGQRAHDARRRQGARAADAQALRGVRCDVMNRHAMQCRAVRVSHLARELSLRGGASLRAALRSTIERVARVSAPTIERVPIRLCSIERCHT